MVKAKKIELYYANWCGHCVKFKPTWDKLKVELDKHNISYNDYEDSTMNSQQKGSITGYPTIKITVDNIEKEYSGPRNVSNILSALEVSGTQSGGNSNYYHKYLKYKRKYIALQKELNMK